MRGTLLRITVMLMAAACVTLEVRGATAKKPAKNASEKKEGQAAAAAKKPEAMPDYRGAIVIDAATGQTLFEDQPDVRSYPASVVKLMDMLIVQEKLDSGLLKLTNSVMINAEASRIGGSQVYLKEKEVFSVDELLYAMMIQSANDAATALAIHIAGGKDAFMGLMNQRAQALGMKSTVYCSVHGLPPAAGQEHDVTTPRDLATLALELLKHKDVLRYTSTRERPFRPDAKEPFIMRNHNNLLGDCEGCDGLKTGYYKEAGYTIVATAQRGGMRVVAVIMGSPSKNVRDAKAKELIAKGFLVLNERRGQVAPAAPAAPAR